MKVTKQARREAKQLFRLCLVDGLLDEGRVRQSVQKVLAVRPRGHVAILTHFHRLVKLDLARRSARVESAVALPADFQATVQSNLARVYGPGLSVAFAEQPALLGGLRVQVGSDVYDGSVRARLAALEQAF